MMETFGLVIGENDHLAPFFFFFSASLVFYKHPKEEEQNMKREEGKINENKRRDERGGIHKNTYLVNR